jgi:SAM-dependent methyltransferase
MKSVQPSENASPDRASASPVFADYAGLYDVLYEDKDYEEECDFLVSIFDRFPHIGVDTVLDMGCGTGGHAFPLAARGYKVTGIDRSEQMLAVAGQKAKASPSGYNLSFIKGDIRNLRLNRRFDSVICMFSVLSYQTSNDDVLSTLKTARHHLKKGGVFVSDFWYGPVALIDKPSNRLKEIRSGAVQVIRVAEPEMDVHRNLIHVHYTTLHIRDNQLLEKIEETHSMRYFFLPEMTFFLGQADFKLVHTCPFGRIDDPVGEGTWNVTVIAQAV